MRQDVTLDSGPQQTVAGAAAPRDTGWYLGVASLTAFGAASVGLAMSAVFWALDWFPPESVGFGVRMVAHGTLALVSLGMFVLGRRGRLPAERLIHVALAYEVVATLGIAMPVFFDRPSPLETMARVPWAGVWMVLFPLIVPAPVKKHALATLACAGMVAVAYTLARVFGYEVLPTWQMRIFHFMPIAVCGFLALVPAARLYRLTTRMSAAQDELRRLGSYRLVRKLGEGGMGEVWIAEHAMLSRPAAVKLVKPDPMATERDAAVGRERFEREAAATARLRSPHTIELYDYGVTESGDLYYAMELLEGLDLETLVTRHGPVPPARAVHVLRQMCDSLGEAHAAGLIHRDIKPPNVFVCRMGLQNDFVKVLDFGLVAGRRIEREESSRKLTGEGFVVGTVGYMAPEATMGEGESPAGDVYAIGCVAYYLLTGKPVFEAPSPMKVLMAHNNERPSPPSRYAPNRVPEALDGLVLDCLAKKPAERPDDARALGERLDALAAELEERWTPAMAAEWWSRRMPSDREREEIAAAATAILPDAVPHGDPDARATGVTEIFPAR